MTKLNIPYFNDEKITFLKRTINVIQKNNVNVVICVIKGKINGYPLGIEDYEIEDKKLKYCVELPYMYKEIVGKDIDSEKLGELKNKLKRYRSINSQKMHFIELTDEEFQTFQNFKEVQKNTDSISLENANKKISDLENKNKVLENEKKEFENKNKQKDLKFLN